MRARLVEKLVPEQYQDGIPSLDVMLDGESFDLTDADYVGRNKDACTIVVPMDKNQVSRIHLRIEKIKGKYYFQDLNSKNGTRIESPHFSSQTIQPRILYPLHTGDYLVLGFHAVQGAVFQFKEKDDA